MKIKRSSWHYKISNFGTAYESEHDSLCWYFWRAVAKTIFIFTVTIWLSTTLFFYFTSPQFISTTIMILFMISCIIVPSLAIHYLRKLLGKSPEIPGSNILIEYLKAKKAKICPLIEYID